jgi:hypothetical protein
VPRSFPSVKQREVCLFAFNPEDELSCSSAAETVSILTRVAAQTVSRSREIDSGNVVPPTLPAICSFLQVIAVFYP